MESKKIISKRFLLLIFCLHSVFAVAQRPSVELTVTQPSPNLNIRLLYDKYNLIAGQEYTIIIQNLSNKNMHVKGQLVALLVCGNEVSTKFDEVLKPSEKMGGHAYLFDASGMTGIVRTEDCQNFETVLNEKGNQERNRIRTLQLRSYSSVIEKTDEEKAEEQRQQQVAAERKQQEEASKQAAANQQIKMQHDAQIQQQNAYNQRQQQFQAQMQALQNQQQQNQQTITDMGNALVQGIQDIAAIYERKRQREEAEQEQQRLQADMDRLQKEKEDEDRKQRVEAAEKLANEAKLEAYKVEQKRIADETANIELWQNKSSDIFIGKLDQYKTTKSLINIKNPNIDSVYYIVWNFTKNNEIIISQPIEIKKSQDGDWILNSDLKKQLVTKTKLNLGSTPDGTSLKENELSYLIGYIEDSKEASDVYNQLIQNATSKGMNIIELATKKEKLNTNVKEKSFWEESTNTQKHEK